MWQLEKWEYKDQNGIIEPRIYIHTDGLSYLVDMEFIKSLYDMISEFLEKEKKLNGH